MPAVSARTHSYLVPIACSKLLRGPPKPVDSTQLERRLISREGVQNCLGSGWHALAGSPVESGDALLVFGLEKHIGGTW